MAAVAPGVAGTAFNSFTSKEINAIVDTAHSLGVKVAVHSNGKDAPLFLQGRKAAVDSVEHAYEWFGQKSFGEELSPVSNANTPIWVPTLSAYYTLSRNTKVWATAQETFRRAIQEPVGVKIACGGDTGVFPHGDNSLEMKLMVRLGAHWSDVLRWGTLGGWECIRSRRWEGPDGEERLQNVEMLEEDARVVGDNEVPFGAVRKGFAADIIATSGDMESDFEHAVDKGSIVFVMKGGRVYKRDGRESV